MLARSPALADRIVVAAVAIATYAVTVGHGFVWDDVSILLAHRDLGEWRQAGALLLSNFFREAHQEIAFDYWRPLVVLTHVLERAAFGTSPAGPHLLNVLFHAATSVGVAMLAAKSLGSRRGSLFAGLLFAVHPVHVEAVAWVSGRSDLLAGLALAAALGSDLEGGRTGRLGWRIASGTAFLLALLAKESAAVFPALVLVRALLWPPLETGAPRRLRRAVVEALPAIGILAAWLGVRYLLVGVEPPGAELGDTGRAALFWTWWSAFGRYLRLLLLPLGLTIEHDLPLATSPLDPRVVAGLASFAGLATIAWLARRRAPGLSFGIAVWLVSMAPLTHFIAPLASHAAAAFPFAERYLYLPSIGFCLVAGWSATALVACADRALRRRRDGARPTGIALVWIPALALVVAAAIGSVRRSLDWRDETTLFAVTARQAPRSAMAHANLAAARVREAVATSDPERRRSRIAAGLESARRALVLEPRHWRAWVTLGDLERLSGRTAAAELAYREAVAIEPRSVQGTMKLGVVLAARGALEESLRWLESAAEMAPGSVEAIVNRAHVLQMSGRPREAIPLYERALEIDPTLDAAREALERARAATTTSQAP